MKRAKVSLRRHYGGIMVEGEGKPGNLAALDTMLQEAYTGNFPAGVDPRKTRDPLCLEWKRLGGFDALRGKREWVDCHECHDENGRRKPEYQDRECRCEHGEHHLIEVPLCPKCKGAGGWNTGKWIVRPTKDPVKRRRLKAILKKAGEFRLQAFESGGLVATLNAEVPLYKALERMSGVSPAMRGKA